METTGLDPNSDQVVEVAAARGDLSVLLLGETKPYFQTFEARVNRGLPIPEAASQAARAMLNRAHQGVCVSIW